MIFSAVFADCHSCHLCALLCHRDTTVSPILLEATTSRLTSALLRAARALGRAGCWPTPWPRRCFAGRVASQARQATARGVHPARRLRRDRRRRSRRASARGRARDGHEVPARVEPVSPGRSAVGLARGGHRETRVRAVPVRRARARGVGRRRRRDETRRDRRERVHSKRAHRGVDRAATAGDDDAVSPPRRRSTSTCTPRSPRAATPRYSISRMRARPRAWRRRTARRRTARRRRSAFGCAFSRGAPLVGAPPTNAPRRRAAAPLRLRLRRGFVSWVRRAPRCSNRARCPFKGAERRFASTLERGVAMERLGACRSETRPRRADGLHEPQRQDRALGRAGGSGRVAVVAHLAYGDPIGSQRSSRIITSITIDGLGRRDLRRVVGVAVASVVVASPPSSEYREECENNDFGRSTRRAVLDALRRALVDRVGFCVPTRDVPGVFVAMAPRPRAEQLRRPGAGLGGERDLAELVLARESRERAGQKKKRRPGSRGERRRGYPRRDRAQSGLSQKGAGLAKGTVAAVPRVARRAVRGGDGVYSSQAS